MKLNSCSVTPCLAVWWTDTGILEEHTASILMAEEAQHWYPISLTTECRISDDQDMKLNSPCVLFGYQRNNPYFISRGYDETFTIIFYASLFPTISHESSESCLITTTG